MSNIDEREIVKRFEAISGFKPVPEVAARDIARVRQKLSEHDVGQGTGQQSMWRIIMRRPITKLAGAAVIVLGALVAVTVFTARPQGPPPPSGPTAIEKEKKVEAELRQIEQIALVGDARGLATLLCEGDLEYESLVVAANYLADIGDLNSVPALQELDNEYGGTDSTFADAIDAIEAKAAQAGTGAANVAANVPANVAAGDSAVLEPNAAVGEQPARELLELLPAETLFCLRINNLDYTVGTIDQFLVDLSPVPMAVTMAARMQVAGVLGDPALNGVNTSGNFAVFGVSSTAESAANPLENLFLGWLIPVADYSSFIRDNTNCGPPDSNGVSIIKSGGTVNPDKKMLITQVAGYALAGPENAYQKLVSLRKSISSGARGLGSSLDAGEVKAATTQPLWAYCNIRRTSRLFGPVVEAKLEEIKKQLETMNANQQGFAPPAMMNMYFGMLDILTKEVEFVSLTVDPKADILKVRINMGAVPETYMAKMLVADTSDAQNNLLGYLRDEAVANFGIKMNTPFWKELNLSQFDLLSFLGEEDISEETVTKVERLVADMTASVGGPGVMSYDVSSQSRPPFTFRYVIDIEDPNGWNQVIDSAAALWNTGGFADIYRKLGMETRLEYKRNVYDYNDVPIDSGKFVTKPIDGNSVYGRMIEKMQRGGLEYRWAMVGRLWLCAVGGDCDAAIRRLIDEVKAGGSDQVPPATASALSSVEKADTADFVGTFNFVRYLRMAGAMAAAVQGMDPTGSAMLQMDVPDNAGMAFAGRVYNGKMGVEIALPKQHLVEIKAAAEVLGQEMMALQARQEAVSEITSAMGLGPAAATDSNLMAAIDTVANEENAIEGLGAFADIAGGRYPSSLASAVAIEEAGHAFQKAIVADPNRGANASPTQQEIEKFAGIEACCSFYAKLIADHNEPVYHGANVTSEFPQAVLLRWKSSDGWHRVIFGDLSVQTVSTEKLAELESMPLNRSAKAIRPDPPHKTMAKTIGDLRLSWLPGMNAAAHRVYLGTSADELPLLAELTTADCDKLPEMGIDTTYYWRVDEIQADGSVVTGDLWTFNTNRLCAWWNLDETRGTTAVDSSGNAYHGMVVKNTPLWNPEGRFAGCLNFNETYGVSVPGEVFASHVGSEITISVWVNGDPNQPNRKNVILQAGSGDAGKPYIISIYTKWQEDGRVDFKTGYDEPDELRYNAASEEWAGQWNHYAFVKNCSEGFQGIYLNGDLVAEKTGATASMAGVSRARIGIAPDRFGDQYIGKLDDVRIYNYALSQAEIAEIYHGY